MQYYRRKPEPLKAFKYIDDTSAKNLIGLVNSTTKQTGQSLFLDWNGNLLLRMEDKSDPRTIITIVTGFKRDWLAYEPDSMSYFYSQLDFFKYFEGCTEDGRYPQS